MRDIEVEIKLQDIEGMNENVNNLYAFVLTPHMTIFSK